MGTRLPRSRRRVGSASAGTELARVLLRVSIGSTMVAHGVKHGRSLEGTAGWFEAIGFREPELQARLSWLVEVGAGSALTAGVATPAAASAVIGTMGVAAVTVHRENGFFVTNEGHEYVLALAIASAATAALGGGRFSVDRLLRRDRQLSGAGAALIAVAGGLAGAAVQLKMFWRRPDR